MVRLYGKPIELTAGGAMDFSIPEDNPLNWKIRGFTYNLKGKTISPFGLPSLEYEIQFFASSNAAEDGFAVYEEGITKLQTKTDGIYMNASVSYPDNTTETRLFGMSHSHYNFEKVQL